MCDQILLTFEVVPWQSYGLTINQWELFAKKFQFVDSGGIRTFPSWTIAPNEIPPRTIPPGLLRPGQLPPINSPLDNCPPDNCPLMMKFPLGQFPPDFCPLDNYPWLIPSWTTTPDEISPQDNYPPDFCLPDN